jgi:hypothetical protein
MNILQVPIHSESKDGFALIRLSFLDRLLASRQNIVFLHEEKNIIFADADAGKMTFQDDEGQEPITSLEIIDCDEEALEIAEENFKAMSLKIQTTILIDKKKIQFNFQDQSGRKYTADVVQRQFLKAALASGS